MRMKLQIFFVLALLIHGYPCQSSSTLEAAECRSCHAQEVEQSSTPAHEIPGGGLYKAPQLIESKILDQDFQIISDFRGPWKYDFRQGEVLRAQVAEPAPVPTIPMEKPDSLMGWIAFGAGFIVLMANMFTAWLPSTIQGSPVYNMLMKALNFLAMNFGKNKNRDDLPLAIANKPPLPLTEKEENLIKEATNPGA